MSGMVVADDAKVPKAKTLEGTSGVKVVVRAQGPYDADVPLQVVCYFKHGRTVTRTLGAAVVLDERLGGVIASLRNRGEFVGDESETLLLTPPRGTIKPRLLLLVGLGDERSLSLDTMERVGRTAQRQAARLGVKRVAFAPLLRDQGNATLAVGDVETAVIRGMLLAYDTDKRLQKEGLATGLHPGGVGRRGGACLLQRHRGGGERGGSPRRRRSPPSGPPPLTPGRESRPA